MKIVADENIPLLEHYFGGYGELFLKPGRAITRSDVIDADILLTRSVTKVNQALLQNTRVKFVGSATSGADHLDTNWLDENNIQWSVAYGCNTIAVTEYVVCAIAALQKINLLKNKNIRAGVVGVGRIGQQVANLFTLLGFDVVLCDPFRTDIHSTPFDALKDLDLISFHTPLTKTGLHPTYHLVQKDFLQQQKKNCILLNTGRGAVFSFDQLKMYGQECVWCLDVWENEPDLDAEVLDETIIATPHIAGYSLQSKYRGIEMIYHAAVQKKIIESRVVNKPIYPTQKISIAHVKNWRDAVLSIFDPMIATQETKEKWSEDEKNFDVLRKKWADRYEFGFVELIDMALSESDRLLLKQLGVSQAKIF